MEEVELRIPDLHVKCYNCGGVYFRTNEQFNPLRVCNGLMLDMLEPFATYGWFSFSRDESTIMDALVCPDCDAPLCNGDGHVRLVDDKDQPVDFQTYLPALQEQRYEPKEKDVERKKAKEAWDAHQAQQAQKTQQARKSHKGKKYTVVKDHEEPKKRVYMCLICNEIVDGSHRLGGHMTKHVRAQETKHVRGNNA